MMSVMDVIEFSVRKIAEGYIAVGEGGAVVTAAPDFESLKDMARDAVSCHLDGSVQTIRLVFEMEAK